MTNEFVNFKIAKKLKDIGFECKHPFAMYSEYGIFHALFTSADYYNCESGKYREYYGFEDFDEHDYICPTISQVLKWFRDVKNIHIEIYTNASGYNYIISDTPKLGGSDQHWSEYEGPNDSGCWDFYEECVIAGIEYCLDSLI